MKVTNTSKAPQGVHTEAGLRYIPAGASADVEFSEAGLKQAQRLSFLTLEGKPEAKPKAERPPASAFTTKHKGGGRYVVLDAAGEEVPGHVLVKADAEAFNGLSDEDKAAFLAPRG